MITRRLFLSGSALAPLLARPVALFAMTALLQPAGRLTTRSFGARHDDATDDTAALEAALRQAVENRQVLTWSNGIARVSRPVRVPDGARVVAESATSGIRNVSRRINNLRAPLLLGNWHPAYLGFRALGVRGAAAWRNPKADLHPTRAGVTAAATSVRLSRAADAALFRPGQVYPLLTAGMTLQESTHIQMRVSREQSLLRVSRVDPTSGTITFETPIGFDSAEPLHLVRIRDGALDDHGLPIGIAQDIRIDGLKVYGFNAFGNNCAAMYNCRLTNFGGEVVTPVMANALVRTVIDGYRGRFSGSRLIEVKYGHHDGTIRNFVAEHVGSGSGRGQDHDGMFSVGEYCRDLLVENFEVNAPNWRGGHLFQIQPGRNCVFRNGKVHAPAALLNAVWFYGDPLRSAEGCGLEGVEVTHGSDAHVVFAAGPHEARRCFVRGCTFVSRSRRPLAAVVFLGGQENRVIDNDFDSGGVIFSGPTARDNVVESNRFATPVVEGAFKAQNRVGTNHARSPAGQLVPFTA